MDPQQATPEENAELERAWAAVAEVLYGNDKTHQAIVKKLDPKDKVGSAAMVTVFVITEVDKKINIDEGVIAGLVPNVLDAVIEIAEKARDIPEYTEKETKRALGTAMEQTLAAYGVEEEDYKAFVKERGLDSPAEQKKAKATYQEMLDE